MLWWLTQNTLTAAALAGVVVVFCRLRPVRPAVQHALWLVVLLKLLTPPFIEWPWTVPDFAQTAEIRPTSEANSGETLESAEPALDEVVAFLTSDEPLPGNVPPPPPAADIAEADETSPASQVEAPPGTHLAWLAPLALYLWLAGSLSMGLVQLVRIVRMRRMLAQGQPPPHWLLRQVKELARQLRMRRPQLLVVPGSGSPFVWGLGRPKLLWPASLQKHLPAHCRRSVLLHELAHLRRRDHWVGWLQLVAECVWWWNPLFWYVRSQLRLQAELACDAWVVWTLPEDRRAYAEALLEVTQLVSQTAAPALALGMSSGARHTFERRLTMIMQDRSPCRLSWKSLAAVGLLALLAVPGWSGEPAPKKNGDEQGAKPAPRAEPVKVRIGDAVLEFDGLVVEVQNEGVKAGQAKESPDAERERRLEQLEKQIQGLLKEVQALRGKGNKVVQGEQAKQLQARLRALTQPGQPWQPLIVRQAKVAAPPAAGQPIQVQLVPHLAQGLQLHLAQPVQAAPRQGIRLEGLIVTVDGEHEVALSRATYKLSHAKAEALASFLKEHVKASVMEVKVDGDSLTVTTTPNSQKAIRGLIDLIKGNTTAALEVKPAGARIRATETKRALPIIQEGKMVIDGKAIELIFESEPKAKPPEPKKH